MLTTCRAVLRSEGITTGGSRVAERAPNIIDELDALLKGGFSPITIDRLSSIAKKVYLRYMVIGAHNAALGDIGRPVEVYGSPGGRMEPQHEGVEKHGWNGDRQMANLTLRMRDSLWYYEFCHAIVDGDVGRVLEIIKVKLGCSSSELSDMIVSSYGFHSGELVHQTMAKSSLHLRPCSSTSSAESNARQFSITGL